MKFLDLNTGYSFDGLWTEDQSKGYIFWFPNEQSTNITYSMPICLLTKYRDEIELRIEENDIFEFITHSNETETIDGYIFNKPVTSKTLTLKFRDAEQVGNYYARVFNIACKSKVEGEYICKISIGDEGYIRVGADFYNECENTYINLSNMGVEIPETVQKAIYDSNVHEDYKDNIIINRKFKELLSNYWELVANKGSYKSLINSLKWFEWDKELVIKEIWKRNEAGIIMFDDRDLISIFEDKISESFENMSKTTYMSLYYSAFNELDSYDSEFNPVLAETAMKWSKDDMRLKIALLSQFFGTFFMPIHTSILHATVEDKVFTNTIKAISGAHTNRNDSFGDFTYVNSNVKSGDVFKMTNVRAQVSDTTMFGVKHDQSELTFGVDPFPANVKINDFQTFASKYYTGPGVIIPIEFEIPNQTAGDFIKQTTIDFTSNANTISRLDFYNRIYVRNGKFVIKFNYLAKESMKHELRFMFITASSKTISHKLEINVEDADNLIINVYKVQAKDDSNGLTMQDFLNTSNNDHFFKVTKENNNYYIQYLPYMLPDNPLYKDYKGLKLTRTVIFDIQNKNGKGRQYNDYEILVIRGLMDDTFLEFEKYDENNKLMYLIYVSKYFYAELPHELIEKKYNIIRNDLGFYPQFHDLKLMTGNNLENYTVSQYEAVCCAAEINHGRKNERFRYGHMIDTAEWTFSNTSTLENIEHPTSLRLPFVAKKNKGLNPGYYDISFKYSLTNGVKDECRRDSAFRIKVI